MTIVLTVFLLLIAFVVFSAWSAYGKRSRGERKIRIERSEFFQNGRFRNRLPLRNFVWRSMMDSLKSGRHKEPGSNIQVFANDGIVYESPPASGLRVTWLGHSTLLLEIDHACFLIDPVWSKRASPFSWLGPKRWYDPPLSLDCLPPLDAVVISHDHYDHLDESVIRVLADSAVRFVAPLGVGAHLEYWGVSPGVIDELDWWQAITISDVTITATPARHASGRHLFDYGKSLWCGFAFAGSKSVYYSGDTGLFPGFKEIGTRLGPFDLTMIEVGAYNRNWPDWHLGPEQAVVAHQWVRGARMLPLHWGLFNLALHNWTEPMERVLMASESLNFPVLTPKPGQPVEPGITACERWWPELPWQGPHEHAVMSTRLEGLEDHEHSLINGHRI